VQQISTIGYEGISLDTFIAALVSKGIKQVIDVRELPLSRRKGFSKTAISAALLKAGIEYIHLKSLGDPKPGRIAAREGRDAEFRHIFGRHMKTDEAQRGLALCAEHAKTKPSALLCFERCHSCCHRAIVADALRLAYGFRVQHIDTASAPHVSTDRRRSDRSGQGRSASRS
jgi:uncharacterized protein (DUF488 family)